MKKIRELIVAQLRAGLSPQRVALAVTLGIVIGVFPVPGTTTVLCVLAAVVFRLNHVVIQAVNYAVYPVFLVLVLPFVRGGAWLFGTDAHTLTVDGIRASFNQGYATFAAQLGSHFLHAAVAWVIVAPFAALLVWFAIRPIVGRVALSRAPTV